MSRTAVALRLARRDLRQAPLRTALVLVMIALPVAAATAADVLLRPEGASSAPAPPLEPGVDALVREVPGGTDVAQDASGTSWSGGSGSPGPRLEQSEVLAALPDGSRLAVLEAGIADLTVPGGPLRVRSVLADLGDPLLETRFTVDRGRLPAAPDEIAVSPALADEGLPLGSTARDGDGRPLDVVGILPSRGSLEPALLGLTGATPLAPLPFDQGREWLVDSPRPVDWAAVQALNAAGAVVTSRAVLDGEVAAPVETADASSGGLGPVLLLIAAMAVLEVVLLAGPALAVGARRQRTSLAQLAAAGGEPSDGQRVVLAGALLLGVGAATAGIAAGLGLAVLLRGTVSTVGLSPAADLPVVDLVVVFAVAVLSAALAALAPALNAARQDPVAVLAARSDPPRPSRAPVLAGAVLLAVGLVAAVDAARDGSEMSVTLAAVPTVLGAVLLAPAALVLAARAARPLPFVLRYPARDAARQRGRTAPAVGAITAVVAAAVALGIGGASDAAQARASDVGEFPDGTSAVVGDVPSDEVWAQVTAAVRRAAPEADVREVRGVPAGLGHAEVQVCADETCSQVLGGWGGSLGVSALVGPEGLSLLRLPDREEALAALRAGGAVVLSDVPGGAGPAGGDPGGGGPGGGGPGGGGGPLVFTAGGTTVPAPAAVVELDGAPAPVSAVLSAPLADGLGVDVRTVALAVTGPLDAATRTAVEDAVALRAPEAHLSAPPGVVDDRASEIALRLLAAIAACLVLGGVLTSTLLALHDARPEFATLGALGAAGRTRRLVAAGYAATLGLVGAVLGTLAGVVPGVAVAHPLTRGGSPPDGLLPRYLDVPWWLVLLLVAGVPLLAAAVAAATVRGPLPRRSRTALA